MTLVTCLVLQVLVLSSAGLACPSSHAIWQAAYLTASTDRPAVVSPARSRPRLKSTRHLGWPIGNDLSAMEGGTGGVSGRFEVWVAQQWSRAPGQQPKVDRRPWSAPGQGSDAPWSEYFDDISLAGWMLDQALLACLATPLARVFFNDQGPGSSSQTHP